MLETRQRAGPYKLVAGGFSGSHTISDPWKSKSGVHGVLTGRSHGWERPQLVSKLGWSVAGVSIGDGLTDGQLWMVWMTMFLHGQPLGGNQLTIGRYIETRNAS